MRGRRRSTVTSPGRTIGEALDAARSLAARGHAAPAILAVHPVSRSNPFAELLYGRLWDHGIAPLPLARIDDLDELRSLPEAGIAVALHLHWTNKVLEGVADETAGRAAIAAFLGRLDRFRETGGRLIWTIHNVVPHDARYAGLEAELAAGIVARCDAVHVLVAATAAAVAGGYALPPETTFHVPHPSYRGAYRDVVGRAEARHRLGLDPDEVVYALVGAIKPYKGLTELLDAFEAVTATDGRPRRLLVAGRPDGAPETQAFLDRCLDHPLVALHAGRIAEDDVGTFLRAADLAVLPYRDPLNSGVLLLALTFGLPVVAAAGRGIAETVDERVAVLFDPAAADPAAALAAALRAADALVDGPGGETARAAALEIADRHDPRTIAEAFARAIRERVLADPVLPSGRP